MPIEIQRSKRSMASTCPWRKCSRKRAYALEQIDRQRKDFAWACWASGPPLHDHELQQADEIRALGRILKRLCVPRPEAGELVFRLWLGAGRGRGRVRRPRRSGRGRGLPFADRPALAKAFGLDSVDDGAIVIWTTTPWTIPSNQALNLHPEIEYALVRVSPAPVSGPLLLIADRVEDCLKQWQLEGDVIATAPGAALSGIRFRHPLARPTRL